MTTRRRRKTLTSPEEIAAAVPAAALAVFPSEDYRAYFRALTEEVEGISGQHDHQLTMRVAEVLRVFPVEWIRRKLIGP